MKKALQEMKPLKDAIKGEPFFIRILDE